MTSPIHGFVIPELEPVRSAFAANFELRGDLGAAFAVVLNGTLAVDLWGGVADEATGRAWQRDTLQVIFSGTKGLVGLCLLMLVDRGKLDLEAPVSQYWPEFAAHGKAHVRVVDVAAHQARLPGIRIPITEDDIVDDRRMAALLADQPVESDPRAADVYHPLTYGWLCGELVRRVDGRSVGRFFADEVARPLDLELWLGLPRERQALVSSLTYAANWGERSTWDAETLAADDLLACVWANPVLFPPGRLLFNRPAWHRAEIPGGGAIGTARALARLYGCLAMGGTLDGVQLLSRTTLSDGVRPVTHRRDPLLGEPQSFAAGFELQTERRALGPPSDAFGYGGAGGSMHCAWPALGVGVSYLMNRMRDDELVDPRAAALLRALHQALHP